MVSASELAASGLTALLNGLVGRTVEFQQAVGRWINGHRTLPARPTYVAPNQPASPKRAITKLNMKHNIKSLRIRSRNVRDSNLFTKRQGEPIRGALDQLATLFVYILTAPVAIEFGCDQQNFRIQLFPKCSLLATELDVDSIRTMTQIVRTAPGWSVPHRQNPEWFIANSTVNQAVSARLDRVRWVHAIAETIIVHAPRTHTFATVQVVTGALLRAAHHVGVDQKDAMLSMCAYWQHNRTPTPLPTTHQHRLYQLFTAAFSASR